MKLVCPECKNEVDLSPYAGVKPDDMIECDTCGITLMITDASRDELQAEIADEGK